jgi:hypothetical protein
MAKGHPKRLTDEERQRRRESIRIAREAKAARRMKAMGITPG